MNTVTIPDLSMSRALDVKAMSCIAGALGGAPWIFGAFRAFVREVDPILPIVNFNQTNNFFIADQLNVQFQTIDVNSNASNAVVNVTASQKALNLNVG